MKDEPNVPLPIENDAAVGHWLDGLGRFDPRPGFEDRVGNRVRVPLPHWLRGLRDRFRGLVTGVTGWTLLATASLVTATAWGSMIAAGMRYRGVVAGGVSFSLSEVLDAAWQGLTDYVLLPAWRGLGAAREWLAGSRLPGRGLASRYGVVVWWGAIAVWRLMAGPAQS